jgi:UDP-N-acetylmuramate dehydrogenase
VSSGIKLKRISDLLLNACLSGFEFAAHIPACLGGAVCMNAGCFGNSMSDIIESVLSYDYILDKVKFRKNSECGFNYRNSIFSKNPEIILGAVLCLKKSSYIGIKKRINSIKQKRQDTQPSEPSLGSVFKRDGDIIPAKLIDDCGLKGRLVCGAKVSEKHAGFIINYRSAAAKNVMSLIDTIKLKVYNEYNINLQEEIKIIGD